MPGRRRGRPASRTTSSAADGHAHGHHRGDGGILGRADPAPLIARALVGKPRILIFDEATSALDNVTQAIVTQRCRALAVTRIVIAHRLSTVKSADRIYVFDGGRIVQSGKYDDLIRRRARSPSLPDAN